MNKVSIKRRKIIWLCAAMLVVGLSACSSTPAQDEGEDDTVDAATPIALTEETISSAEDADEDNGEAPIEPIAVERQTITFETVDGRTLEGYYYPARSADAAIIVMMHWAPGTMEDWRAMAIWLQNRQDELTSNFTGTNALVSYTTGQNDPWLDSSWFPALPPEVSFGVFVFNFGGRGNSEMGSGSSGLFDDAVAAVAAASRLEGVDPNRITTIGASIGADGSVVGCQIFNASSEYDGTCLGAFSLSPVNNVTKNYGEMVTILGNETLPKTVYCLAAARDGGSLRVCNSSKGDHIKVTEYDGSAHGMQLITPSFSPAPLALFLEFLEIVYGVTLID